ncbi:MAG TPA: lipopolysaccharide assembly protein LapA domain-containing protein [Gammaproteobacteria bacterium]|nr:lipopolysaccharide assembly protein LapA domain-containing protein [Gammaproteobacteria bacterium]
MLRWITLISLVLVFVLALYLAYANGAMVRLDYLAGSEEVHLSSALLGAAVIGWLLGLVSGFTVVWRLRRELRRRKRMLDEAESEIRNLRSVPPQHER